MTPAFSESTHVRQSVTCQYAVSKQYAVEEAMWMRHWRLKEGETLYKGGSLVNRQKQGSTVSARKTAQTDVFRTQAQGTGEAQSVGKRRKEGWCFVLLCFFPYDVGRYQKEGVTSSRDLPLYLIKKYIWCQFLWNPTALSKYQHPQFRMHCRKWRLLESCVDSNSFLPGGPLAENAWQ